MWDIGIYKDSILCEIDEVHPILDETFFETHMVDVSRSACSEVVMCHDGKELSLKLRKNSYDRRSQVEFGLIGPNDGRGSIGATPMNSWGG
jgi:hypothetical protein